MKVARRTLGRTWTTLTLTVALGLGAQAMVHAQLPFRDIAATVQRMSEEVTRQGQAAAAIVEKQQAIDQTKSALAEKTAAIATVVARENQLEEAKKVEQAKRLVV